MNYTKNKTLNRFERDKLLKDLLDALFLADKDGYPEQAHRKISNMSILAEDYGITPDYKGGK